MSRFSMLFFATLAAAAKKVEEVRLPALAPRCPGGPLARARPHRTPPTAH